MKMPKVGDLVKVELDDHSNDEKGAILNITVYGKVHEITNVKLVIDVWHPTDGSRPMGCNCVDAYAVVRKAITSVTQLEEVE